MRYRLLTGAGPSTGWVSINLKDKALLVKKASGPSELRDNDYFVTLGPLFKPFGGLFWS